MNHLNENELQTQLAGFADQIVKRAIEGRMDGEPIIPQMFTFSSDNFANLYPVHCYELEEPMQIESIRVIGDQEGVDAWILVYLGEYYDWTKEPEEAELMIPTQSREFAERSATTINPATNKCMVTLVESEFSSYTVVRSLLKDGSFGEPSTTLTPRMGALATATKQPIVIN